MSRSRSYTPTMRLRRAALLVFALLLPIYISVAAGGSFAPNRLHPSAPAPGEQPAQSDTLPLIEAQASKSSWPSEPPLGPAQIIQCDASDEEAVDEAVVGKPP